jgi:putative PEP-CTERM system TPR-repeat lipoprotein
MFCAKAVRLLLVVVLGAGVASCSRNREAQKREHTRMGDQYVAQKKYQEAIIEYKNALKTDPKFGEARHKLAKAFVLANDPRSALGEFIRAADLAPTDAVAQLDAAKALLMAGRFEDARARAQAVLEQDRRSVDAQLVRANASAMLRDFDGAIAAVDQAIELDPTRAGSYIDLAAVRAAAGQGDEAETAFNRAISIDPKSATARTALANYYLATGRVADAEVAVGKALEIDPANVVANRALAYIYLATGRSPKAEIPLKRVAEASEDATARLVLADYYIREHRAAEARPILETLARRQEAFAASTARIAAIEYEAGRRPEAHKMLDEVIAKQPNNARLIVVKGGWLLGERRLDEALVRAQAAVKAEPQWPGGHSLLGSVQFARANAEEAIKAFTEVLKLDPKALNAQLALAELNVLLGRAESGVRFAEQAVSTHPQSADARLRLARSLFAAGQTDRARNELQPLLDGTVKVPGSYTLMGQIQYRKREYAAAQRSFERALELEPDSYDAVTGLVGIAVATKHIDEARRLIQARVDKAPANARLLVLSAKTSIAANDFPAAEASLKKAIDADASALDAYGLLGQLYVRQNRLDEARAEYDRIAARQPRNVTAHTMAAMILQAQNRDELAKARYQKILEIDPRAVVASNNLAYMNAETNTNIDIALQLAQTAKSQLPDNPDVNDTLGWVYIKKGLGSLAIGPLQQSVDKDPKNPIYHLHLGMAYVSTGDKSKARTSLEQALKLKPDLTDAKTALASLKS